MTNKSRTQTTWWQQPLLHFLLVGAAIFVWDSFRDSTDLVDSKRIVVSATQVERLVQQWQMTWGQAPDETELQALVQNYIKEEIYYREALKLGLDVNDPVIRQRLGRKMEFLLVQELDAADVSDAKLQPFYEKNKQRYQTSPVLSFEHVYFADDSSNLVVEAALKQFKEGVDDASLGDSIGLPSQMTKADKADITRTFGSRFYEEILDIEPGQWSGPVRSGFGRHLVRVGERQDSRVPALSEVRKIVANDWLAQQNMRLQQTAYEQLRAHYDVRIDIDSK